LQAARNLLGRIALGLAPVRHGMADTLAEVTIGYASTPLNGPAAHGIGGPGPGERAPPRSGESPVGAGRQPRFVLFSSDRAMAQTVAARYAALVEAEARPPFTERGLWLVRPDGYVAVAAKAGDWDTVTHYLDRLAA
jgi:hypothetical protein